MSKLISFLGRPTRNRGSVAVCTEDEDDFDARLNAHDKKAQRMFLIMLEEKERSCCGLIFLR